MRDEQRQPRGQGRTPVRAVALLGLALSLVLTGCRNRDVVESELRARDFQYRDLLDEMKKSEFHNQALQCEIEAIRRGKEGQLLPPVPELAT